MHGVRFYVIFVLGIVWAGVSYAIEQEETVRMEFQNEIIAQPVVAKKLYREAWKNDNMSEMTTVEQLEHLEKTAPVDNDTKVIMHSGIEMMKKMNFGMKGKGIDEFSKAIRENPGKAIQELSENLEFDISADEFFEMMAETEKASQRLKEKVAQDKSLGKTSYPIDVNSF